MLQNLLTVIILCGFSARALAQNTNSIKGSIADKTDKKIESASVFLLKAKDSAVVKGEVTNKAGEFEFTMVPQGNYLLSVSAVGFEKYYSAPLIVGAADAVQTIPVISLSPASKAMKEVVVTTTRPLIEQKADRLVVNVESSLTATGSTALEVLEKSPGVTVDKDGNISLKGKSGVMVMVDGRQTYLSAADLANMLRSMSSNQLDQIEIMTNPPAKYDAAGNAGIINIKTKKNKQAGSNGSLNLGYGQGMYPKFNSSFNYNYRKNKFNLFTNLSQNYWESFNELDIIRKFSKSDTKELVSIFNQQNRMKNLNRSYNLKVGADYFLSKKTTIGAVVTGFYNPSTFSNQSHIDILDPNYNLLSTNLASSNNNTVWKNLSSNLNFRHSFDSTGKEISADVDYVRYNSTNESNLTNAYFGPDGEATYLPDTLLGNLPSKIRIFTAKTDYSQPLSKKLKFEAGFKTSFVTTDNDAQYDSLKGGVIVPDIGRTNHFVYTENVNAAYVNFNNQFSKKFTAQLGLRLENTNSDGKQLTTNESFHRQYTQLFPTAFLGYTLNDKNQFNLNVGRRIQRPNYQDLNPFIYFLDRYTYQQGNPNLKPQFSQNIELSHTFKSKLTTTLNYTRTTDIIQEVLEQNENTNQTYVKKSNIAKQYNLGLSMSLNTPINKWWTVSLYTNVYHNEFQGIINQANVKVDGTTLLFNGSNQFKFKKDWSAELSGWYRSTGVEGVFVIQPLGQISTAVAKQVMKGKGTIKLSVRDVFYMNQAHGSVKYSNIDAKFTNTRDSRVVFLNFTYRFGKQFQTPKRKTGGSSEEENRVKVNTGN